MFARKSDLKKKFPQIRDDDLQLSHNEGAFGTEGGAGGVEGG